MQAGMRRTRSRKCRRDIARPPGRQVFRRYQRRQPRTGIRQLTPPLACRRQGQPASNCRFVPTLGGMQPRNPAGTMSAAPGTQNAAINGNQSGRDVPEKPERNVTVASGHDIAATDRMWSLTMACEPALPLSRTRPPRSPLPETDRTGSGRSRLDQRPDGQRP